MLTVDSEALQMSIDKLSDAGFNGEHACDRGGAAFIATQALGWALFSSALTTLVWLIAQVAAGMAYCIRCWLLGTSLVMASAWLVSLPAYTCLHESSLSSS